MTKSKAMLLRIKLCFSTHPMYMNFNKYNVSHIKHNLHVHMHVYKYMKYIDSTIPECINSTYMFCTLIAYCPND